MGSQVKASGVYIVRHVSQLPQTSTTSHPTCKRVIQGTHSKLDPNHHFLLSPRTLRIWGLPIVLYLQFQPPVPSSAWSLCICSFAVWLFGQLHWLRYGALWFLWYDRPSHSQQRLNFCRTEVRQHAHPKLCWEQTKFSRKVICLVSIRHACWFLKRDHHSLWNAQILNVWMSDTWCCRVLIEEISRKTELTHEVELTFFTFEIHN